MFSFPIWRLGQDVEVGCIGSWALPFHLVWLFLLSPSQNVTSVLAVCIFQHLPRGLANVNA